MCIIFKGRLIFAFISLKAFKGNVMQLLRSHNCIEKPSAMLNVPTGGQYELNYCMKTSQGENLLY